MRSSGEKGCYVSETNYPPSGSLRMPAATVSGEPDAGNPHVRSMRVQRVVLCIARCSTYSTEEIHRMVTRCRRLREEK
jgi:hypothetical protein